MNSGIVSILIPCYNAKRWIAEAIQSALNQTYTNKEIIVVDDGSTDGSLEIIKSFGDQIRWESGPNQGGNVARNRLLEMSRGTWLQYLDADDYLLPDKIEQQMQYLDKCNNLDVLCSPTYFELWKDEEKPEPLILTTLPNADDPWELLLSWKLPQTGGPIWRRQALINVGGWNIDLPCCQEHDLYLRLLKTGSRFRYCNQCAAVYRYHSTDTVSRRNELVTKRMQLQILDQSINHLEQTKKLTKRQLEIVNQTRFHCARFFWDVDRAQSIEIEKSIRYQNRRFSPDNISTYKFAYRLLGFQATEHIAKSTRGLRFLANRYLRNAAR